MEQPGAPSRTRFVAAVVALAAVSAALLASTGAQARGSVDVQWQVNVVTPTVRGVAVLPPLPLPPLPRVVVHTSEPRWAPVYTEPPRHPGHPAYHRDSDRDGIPDRYDRVYNPRWDVDGDGVPNRYDRRPYDPRVGAWHPHGHRGDWRDDRREWRDERREWRDDRREWRDDRRDWRDDRRDDRRGRD